MRNAVTAEIREMARRRKTKFTTIALMLWSCLGFAVGCGGSKGPVRAAVSGTVKLDGAAIADGRINFRPNDPKAGPISSGPISQGKYSISSNDGPTLGDHKIEIYSMKKTGKQIPVVPPAISASGVVDEMVEAVPSEFNSQTTLTKTIKSGSNTLDFDLKSK